MPLFPEREAAPIDPPPDGDEYGVSPFPKNWSEMTRPSDGTTPPEPYAVGEEVAETPFQPEAKTWREIVAAPNRPVQADNPDEDRPYDVATQGAAIERRTSRWTLYTDEAAAKLQARDDQRIGQISDPRRFTITRLLFVLTLASIVLAAGTQLPRGVFAGVAGAATLLTAFFTRWFLGDSAFAQLAWWTLMSIYLIASVFSLLSL
jgi:hypothetical protein